MSDEPRDQLDELKDALARDKHCLAAAELELAELNDRKIRIEEEICRTERAVKDWVRKVDNSWTAVRRRIDAETDSPLETEVVNKRCQRLLGPLHGV